MPRKNRRPFRLLRWQTFLVLLQMKEARKAGSAAPGGRRFYFPASLRRKLAAIIRFSVRAARMKARSGYDDLNSAERNRE